MSHHRILVIAVLPKWTVKTVVREPNDRTDNIIVVGDAERAVRSNGEALGTGHIGREV